MQMGGKSSINIESLPDELLFAILVHLPASDILNGAMLVCRKWHRIINSPGFIHAHLQHSPPGLLIQYSGMRGHHKLFVSVQQGRITTSELNCNFKGYSMGCNGLVVESSSLGNIHVMNPTTEQPTFYVVNPATEQRYALPSITLPPHFGDISYTCPVIAYDAASMKYKLAFTYFLNRMPIVQGCAIITAGVDSHWRHVDTNHLSLSIREFVSSFPLITQGFIHWTASHSTRVLTLNVETEVFTSTPIPLGYEKRSKCYLLTGSSVTMVVTCSDLSWEVWELKQESGEWMKPFKIDLEDRKHRFQELVQQCSASIQHDSLILRPVGWLNYGEVLVLAFFSSHRSKFCFLYNVRTQEIDSFKLDYNYGSSRFRFHRNSLEQLMV